MDRRMYASWFIMVVMVVVAGGEEVEGEACLAWEQGPWGAALEDWAISVNDTSHRHGRIMALPSPGYYVTERMDGPLVPPPAPPRVAEQQAYNSGPGMGGMRGTPARYEEWRAPSPPGAGKIVNRPNPYKDKPYRPTYSPPGPPIPVQNAVDRVDETPHKQVSETDLYLLGAIEKLVYRVDLMEKRLRRMEETVHYMVAGTEAKPEPCPGNFTRVGESCYKLSKEAVNWKGASIACRKLKATLLELDTDAERAQLQHALLADKGFRGVDWWTGGLNPGLLWIWSHSARPVAANDSGAAPAGDGRCLALVHDARSSTYLYRGRDCSLAHRYVCELSEDKTKLSNEVEHAARAQGGYTHTTSGYTRTTSTTTRDAGDVTTTTDHTTTT